MFLVSVFLARIFFHEIVLWTSCPTYFIYPSFGLTVILEGLRVYLGIIINKQGRSETDMKKRIDKARPIFLNLKRIWNSIRQPVNIKDRIFNMNVKIVLSYEAKIWRANTIIIKNCRYLNITYFLLHKLSWIISNCSALNIKFLCKDGVKFKFTW